MNNEVEIQRWDTIISDMERVIFEHMIHRSDLRFVVSNEDEGKFMIVVPHPRIYRVIDESYLVPYWLEKGEDIGTTFTVEGVKWDCTDEEQFGLHYPHARRYVVATLSCCLEIMSEKEPSIIRMDA